MPARPFRLARSLPYLERRVLAMIRGQHWGMLDILPKGAPSVGEDEALLIASVAYVQRDLDGLALYPPRYDQEGMVRLVERMAAVGLILPFSPLHLTALHGAGWVQRPSARGDRPRALALPTSTHSSSAIPPHALKQRALALARSQSVVTSADLQAIGLSRQYISKIHREGYLERVSFGIYRLTRSP